MAHLLMTSTCDVIQDKRANGRITEMAVGVPTYKIILCGEYGVGKSSLFKRFMNNTFKQNVDRRSTIGLDQCSRVYDMYGEKVKLTLWDTGGMERMSFIGSSYYRGADAALLCYSCKDKETFAILEQYILDIVMNAEGAKIFLCGNFADCINQEDSVSEADLESFARECADVLSGSYTVSCRDNQGISEMFRDMANQLHESSRERVRTLKRGNGGIVLHEHTFDKPNGRRRCCSSS